MPFALLYHDVVPADRAETSGFPGGEAARYKLAPGEFTRHLDSIATATPGGPRLVNERLWNVGWMLTFDDGGVTALEPTATLLEQRGWRGHFFVTMDRIGTPGFLDAEQLRALRRRGHLIGSHSCSHPPRMSACNKEQLDREWSQSKQTLSELLAAPVEIASVPGGDSSHAVAVSAARAGYKVLFTAEPTARTYLVEGCHVVGRYSVHRGVSAATAAALAAGKRGPRWRQAALWKLDKAAKALGGALYLRLPKGILNRVHQA